MTDREETLLKESLDRRAAQAPGDADLLDQVHARLRRRRSGRTTGAIVLACAAVATGIFGIHSVVTPGRGTDQIAVDSTPGWRWESYKTVQVQVPVNWTNYVSGPMACKALTPQKAPTIGRLDDWTDPDKSPCNLTAPPWRATQGDYLWFGNVKEPDGRESAGGLTAETRWVSNVKLTVATKDRVLRRQILDSAVPITSTDHYGCKPTDPLGASLSVSPAPVGTKDNLGTVESVDICEYWTGPLIASSRLTGPNARALAQGLADAASVIAPPTWRAGCMTATSVPGSGYGNNRLRSYRLTLHGSDGDWQGWLRYTSCFGNMYPFDDGNAWDLASAGTVALVRTGPHAANPPTR